MLYICIIIISFITSLLFTKAIIKHLSHKNIVDTPNHRSFHTKPIPVGGGWAIIATIIPAITLYSYTQNILHETMPIILGSLILALISWQDDKKHVNPLIRIAFYIFAITISMLSIPSEVLIFNGAFPIWLERLGIFLCWLWFINLYNFMDGIDGITGSKTSCICLGILILSIFLAISQETTFISALTLGASLGFLAFNWQPAKIFPGDTGSIFLGHIMAYLLLKLAIEGYVVIALLLPMYYIMDTTIVLIKRLLKREEIWQAHQQQYFHKSVNEMGRSHAKTTGLIILCNFILISLAVASILSTTPALFLATGIIITYGFMHYLANKKVS